ncbi:MAG: hypothetical protein JWO30_3621 [Fibrobacteres bacterium]|nr:hypothetical protein [Fibrobacterota bacterium]
MKIWKLVSLVIPAILAVVSLAPANPHSHRRVVVVHHPHEYVRVVVRGGGNPYYYHYGHFYGRRRHAYFLMPPPLGVTVAVVPSAAVRLRYGPSVYYYYEGIYYRTAPEGYVVVQKPDTVYVEKQSDAVKQEETFQEPKATTIEVVNSNGSKTPVRLEELAGGKWRGPREEVYDTMPTQDQLRSAYGF